MYNTIFHDIFIEKFPLQIVVGIYVKEKGATYTY